MAMSAKLKQRVFTVFFMFAVTLLFISLVSLLHLATRDAVSRNAYLFLQKAIMEASGRALPERDSEVRSWYAAHVKAEPAAGTPDCYVVRDAPSGPVRARVFVGQGPGLWGRITAVVGIDMAARAVTGVSFTDQNETPGLGARIEEGWFKAQFRGKVGPLKLVPEGTRSAVPQEIDGVTGATVTSTAVRDIVNAVIRRAAAVSAGAPTPP